MDSFSKSATFYDQYDHVQSESARELMKWVSGKTFSHVRELGCGTGKHTVSLLHASQATHLLAIDRSADMIEYAKLHHSHPKISYRCQSFESTDLSLEEQLIFSNASLQWSCNLERVLTRLCAQKQSSCWFLASLFGPETFKELAVSLRSVLGAPVNLPSASFYSDIQLYQVSKDLFSDLDFYQEKRIRVFPTVTDLFKSIKYTGTKGRGIAEKKIWTRHFLEKLDTAYRHRYGDIAVTYQVFYIRAR